jgi:hypothetical protein
LPSPPPPFPSPPPPLPSSSASSFSCSVFLASFITIPLIHLLLPSTSRRPPVLQLLAVLGEQGADELVAAGCVERNCGSCRGVS